MSEQNGNGTHIKAIETVYAGHRFRSRLEARWAVFMDALDEPYEYEKEGFDLGECGRYLPDFWLPKRNMWLEIKPEKPTRVPDIYLAGKMWNGWRDQLSHDLRMNETGPHWKAHDVYGGQGDIVSRCVQEIIESDAVFAWIDDLTAFGSFAEIGYAACFGDMAETCEVWLAIGESLRPTIQKDELVHDLWFIEKMADKSGWFKNADMALREFCGVFSDAEKKCHALMMGTHQTVVLRGGSPRTGEYGDTIFNYCGPYSGAAFSGWCKEASIERALEVASQARFEHGETPDPKEVRRSMGGAA